MKCSEKCIHQYFCKFKEEGSNCDYCEERPHITDEQISNAFQVAIANYWEEKSKYLTPPPSPCCDFQPHDKWEYLKEHITEMRDADGELNQKQTCQFILELMGVIEREGETSDTTPDNR